MTTTTTRDLADHYTVRLSGERLETVYVCPCDTEDDDDTIHYRVESDEDLREYLDLDEARSAVADMARTLRAERLEQLTDAAVDAVTALLDDGRALEVARVLRAAGLL